MAVLGTVELFVENEGERHFVDATSYAVEEGEPFTDHIAKRSPEFSLTGYILSDDWNTDKEKLISMMNAGKITTYIGRMTASSVVILNISGKHGAEIANGMAIEIALRRVRLTITPWQKAKSIDKPAQKPPTSGGVKKPVTVKPRTDPAVYHVVRKGDTYYGLSGSYGSSIAQLRAWNKYADTKIPINAKLRVK